MLIYDDTFTWEGWGGKLRLGSGACRLKIFDLAKESQQGLAHLKPIIVVVEDVAEGSISVKSCAGHIATKVTQAFGIDPHRMLYVEHYPAVRYGMEGENVIPEQYEAVEFDWREGKALHPRWRSLNATLLEMVQRLLAQTKPTQRDKGGP